MSEGTTRLLLVDDHAMLREGLRRSLTSLGYEIAGEVGDGESAIQAVAMLRPDVVLMDVTMPVMDGLEAAERIRADADAPKVIMLTMHDDPQLAHRALVAGAAGYLVKDCTTDAIKAAIDAALDGRTTFPEGAETRPSEVNAGSPITQREIEVLQLIANGKATPEVASELYVSVKTVKNHLGSIYAKLDTHDRTQAVLKAARLGLIKLGDGA